MDKNMDQKYAMPLRELVTTLGLDEREVKETLVNDFGFELPTLYTRIPSPVVRKLLEGKRIKKKSYDHKVISFINLKGGVGKTVSAAGTATRAVQYGFNTCLIDMDMQASLTLLFDKMPGDDDPVFIDIWQDPASMLEAALTKIEDNLYLLPSCLENGLLDSHLSKPASQRNAVRGVCRVLEEQNFDLVVIDCPPSLGTAVISSICAADIIVIPVGNDSFSLKGMNLAMQEIDSICSVFGLAKPQVKILFTRYDKREKMAKDTYQLVAEKYKEFLVPGYIHTSTDFSKAVAKHETIFASSRKSQVKTDYDGFVRNILNIKT